MYRAAKCIELYEAGITINVSTEGYSDTGLIGRSMLPDRTVYKIPMSELITLGKALGLNVEDYNSWIDASYLSNQSGVRKGRDGFPIVQLGDADINILRPLEVASDDFHGDAEITSLKCEVLGPNLVNI